MLAVLTFLLPMQACLAAVSGLEERGKYVVPSGTIESLSSYLKYAPSGDHARVVQDMIKTNPGRQLREHAPELCPANRVNMD